MVTCHSSVPLVTSRLQSHCQSSTEKTSKGSTSPSPGLQHKGLFHTSSCVATTRKTLNMTVLQFYPALGCSPLLKRKLTPIASSQTYPLPSCKPLKSSSESHMEANTCTSKTFLRTNLSSKWWICVSRYQVTILCLQQCPSSIKEYRTEMQLLKRCREMGCTAQQQSGLRLTCLCCRHKCWAGDHIPALLTLAWHTLLYLTLVSFTKH